MVISSESFQPEMPNGQSRNSMRFSDMKDEYDFSMSQRNPYSKQLKEQITIRIDQDTIEYFRKMAEDKGIPYQSLINLYLRDCAQTHKELKVKWA